MVARKDASKAKKAFEYDDGTVKSVTADGRSVCVCVCVCRGLGGLVLSTCVLCASESCHCCYLCSEHGGWAQRC